MNQLFIEEEQPISPNKNMEPSQPSLPTLRRVKITQYKTTISGKQGYRSCRSNPNIERIQVQDKFTSILSLYLPRRQKTESVQKYAKESD
jgi:hypothetical protein